MLLRASVERNKKALSDTNVDAAIHCAMGVENTVLLNFKTVLVKLQGIIIFTPI